MKKLFEVSRLQQIKRWACPVADSFTHISGEGGRLQDSSDNVLSAFVEVAVGDSMEFKYSSPSFGPSTGQEQTFEVVHIVAAEDGDILVFDNGARYMLQDGRWMASYDGREYVDSDLFKAL